MKTQKLTRIVLILSMVITTSAAVAQEEGEQRSREEVREAMRECHEAAGLEKPEHGERPRAPSETQRALIDACLKEKGIEIPHFRGLGPRRESDTVQ